MAALRRSRSARVRDSRDPSGTAPLIVSRWPRPLAALAAAFAASAACLILADPAAGAEPPQRPNIVFLLADDLGYGDLACYDRPDIRTPRLDRLAREGVRFTSCYANGPECTPTRAALMTGRYPHRVGGLECAIGTGNVGRYDDAIRLRETGDLGLPVEETTIARWLKDAGYTTGITGKWHLGYEPKFGPHLHGFDHAFYCIGGGMDYFHYLDDVAYYNLFQAGHPIRREGYFTDLVAEEASRFIERSREVPFFLYVPFTAPHSPFQGPDDRQPDPLPLDSPLWNQGRAPPGTYVAMIERMDAAAGAVLDALQRNGLESSTLVIFTSDNGGTASARNAPYSGIKGSTLEGGIRVPAIARWPGVLPAGAECRQVCVTFDFTASIARIAGAAPPPDRPLDGFDILDHVVQRRADCDRTLYWRKPRGETVWMGVRDGNLKYVAQRQGERLREQLFDLAADPAEQHDLKDPDADSFQRLRALYENWEREVRQHRRGQP